MFESNLHHIARAAAALVNSPQVAFTGLASVMRQVAAPSPYLQQLLDGMPSVDLIVFDNEDPQRSNELLRDVLGEGSAFHRRYGYYANVRPPWDWGLPTHWSKRLTRDNLPLRTNGPHILLVSLTDILLGDIANKPNKLLQLELIIKQYVSLREAHRRLENWDLSDSERRRTQRYLQTLERIVVDFGVAVGSKAKPHSEADQVRLSRLADESLPELESMGENVVPIIGVGRRRRA